MKLTKTVVKPDKTLIKHSPLTPIQKETLTLIDVEHVKPSEVARRRAKDKSTISNTLKSARQKFDEWMATLDEPAKQRICEDEEREQNANLEAAERAEGVTFEERLSEFKRMKKDSLELSDRADRLRQEIGSLESRLEHLHELETLDGRLKKNGISIRSVDGFIERHLRLDSLSFSTQAAEALSSELSKTGLNPKKASELVAQMLSEYGTTEKALAGMRTDFRRAEKQLKDASGKLDLVKLELADAQSRVTLMANQVGSWKERESKQEKLFDARVRQLEDESATKMLELENQYSRRRAELEAETAALRESGNKIRVEVEEQDRANEMSRKAQSEIADNLKKLQDEVAKHRVLATIASVIASPNPSVPPVDVSKAALSFLGGFRNYLNASALASTELKTSVEEICSALSRDVRYATGH